MVSSDNSVRLRSVVPDCADPKELAEFYRQLLGGTTSNETSPTEWGYIAASWAQVRLSAPDMVLAFQPVQDYVPPQWPDGQPQQLHLDFDVDDIVAASRRVVALGGKVLSAPFEEDNCTFVVHQDPAGHPFCLCQLKRRS